jgi:hypothetical protein
VIVESITATKSTTWLAAALAFAAVFAGCQAPDAGDAGASSDSESELVSTNGLSMINGLTMLNGLSGNGLSGNGLSGNGLTGQALIMNPLTTALTSSTFLMSSAAGRSTISYLVRCALPAGRTITKKDSTGASYSFAGGIGVAPQWETASCDGDCQRWISACMLAHVNTVGAHIPIWLVGQNTGLGWGQSAAYPNQEGTFFGNIFTVNNIGHTDAYYCEGPGFDKSVVDGRIGSNQVGAPYRDLFSDGYCASNWHCVTSDAKTSNVADGYKACTMGDGSMQAWNQLVTVWRQNKAYDSSGNLVAGKTADGSTVGYDFESNPNSWTSTATLSSSSDRAQTGTKSLKAVYSGGAGVVRLAGPATLSLPAGARARLYIHLDAASAVTSIGTWVKKTNGSETKNVDSVTNHLKGSWNAFSISVPSSSTGSQVGVDLTTTGAFTAYIDAVTW